MFIKEKLSLYLKKIIKELFEIECLPQVENSKIDKLGDYSTNAAMVLTGKLKQPPMKTAETIVKHINKKGHNIIKNINVSKPGFINFKVSTIFLTKQIEKIYTDFNDFIKINEGNNIKYNIEFVSANPTGPLNIVNARAASTGEALANLLSKIGYNVTKEFYINDAGNQIKFFGDSVRLRYLELFGEKVEHEFSDNHYKGDYVTAIAEKIQSDYNDQLLGLEKQTQINEFVQIAKQIVIEWQQKDLEKYGIKFDVWYSENDNLHKTDKINEMLKQIKQKKLCYEKDDALWMKTTEFGDDKDRTLIRSNGTPTYFLADIAYHKDKFDRGHKILLDLWGPDHHGHIKRTELALKAVGLDYKNFKVQIIQQVNFLESGEQLKMSKRKGKIVELKQLMEDIPNDVSKFFFLMRNCDSHLDFDIELAKKQSNENPVYYVQYAYARICSILKKLESENIKLFNKINELSEISEINNLGDSIEEKQLMKTIIEYPEEVKGAGINLQPHRITNYLRKLASDFHSYYNKISILNADNDNEIISRICLIISLKKVIKDAMDILNINTPEQM